MSRRTLPLQIVSILVLFTMAFSIVAPTQVQAGVFGNIQDDIKEKLEKGFEDGSISCIAAAAVAALFSYLASALTNVPTTDVPAVLKEQIMDCVFWAIKNSIIKEITKNTVGYVQTGMNGNPAFARNVQQYLLSVADKAAGEYIQQTTAGDFLCSPYRGEIQQALTRYYQLQSGRGPSGAAGGGTSCTLTGAVTNIDDFIGGDFSAGGWDAWITMYIDPYNSSQGAYLASRTELDRRIAIAQEEAKQKLQQGNGFLGKETKNCYKTPYTTEDGTVVYFTECNTPETETPGTSVKNAFEQTLGVTMAELANADELSELIALWMTHMLSDMLIGEKGIAGYDPNDFEHTVPETTISDEDWDDIDIGPQPGGESCGVGPYHQPENSGVAAQRSVRIDEPGVVVNPNHIAEEITLTEAGERDAGYSRIEVNFDTTIGILSYTDQSAKDFNGLFWMTRGNSPGGGSSADRWGNNVIINVGYLATDKKVHAQHNMDYPDYGACGISETAGIELVEGETYHATFVYEALNSDQNPGKIELKYRGTGSTQGKNFTLNLTGKAGGAVPFIDLDNIRSGGQVVSSGIKIVLGNGPTSDDWAVPGLGGWIYENVHVFVEPGEGIPSGDDDDDDDTCVPWGTTTCEGPAPTVTLTATSPVNNGSPSTLTWSSQNAESCTAMTGSGFVTGGATSGSDTSDNLATTTTFSVRCRGTGGAKTASAVATVVGAPPLSATLTASPSTVDSGENTRLTWDSEGATSCVVTAGADKGFVIIGGAPSGSDDSANLTTATTFGISCTGAAGVVLASTVVNITGLVPPIATLTASPGTVDSGENTTLTWSSANATSCSVASGGSSGFTISGGATSGSDDSSNLTAPTTFGISCVGAGGTTPASTVVNITGLPPGGSCTNCTPLTDPPFTITAPCGSQCSVDQSILGQLTTLDMNLNNTGDPILAAWRITDAFPPSVGHPNPCYQNGTCVGANINDSSINSETAGYLTSFVLKVWAAGLHVCYEVPNQSTKDAWITAGLDVTPIQVVPGITTSRLNIHKSSANWLECTN